MIMEKKNIRMLRKTYWPAMRKHHVWVTGISRRKRVDKDYLLSYWTVEYAPVLFWRPNLASSFD
jgi:hypothetical protein